MNDGFGMALVLVALGAWAYRAEILEWLRGNR